jgi:hypothetical protein
MSAAIDAVDSVPIQDGVDPACTVVDGVEVVGSVAAALTDDDVDVALTTDRVGIIVGCGADVRLEPPEEIKAVAEGSIPPRNDRSCAEPLSDPVSVPEFAWFAWLD